jgi:hypothetical protein
MDNPEGTKPARYGRLAMIILAGVLLLAAAYWARPYLLSKLERLGPRNSPAVTLAPAERAAIDHTAEEKAFDPVAKSYGVGRAVFLAFLDVVRAKKVTLTDLDDLLSRMARAYNALLADLRSAAPAAGTDAQALAALEKCDFAAAEKPLNAAVDAAAAAAKDAAPGSPAALSLARALSNLAALRECQLDFPAAVALLRRARESIPAA